MRDTVDSISGRPARGAKVIAVSAALLVALTIGFAGAAYALPPEPIERDPGIEPGYDPPPGGFTWTMEPRFGRDVAPRDGVTDYHWDETTATYGQSYVNPAEFKVTFNGCPSQSEYDNPSQTYNWDFGDGTGTKRIRDCRPTHTYTRQGSFDVSLSYGGFENLESFEQTINVRDILIVSLGDSYGSGEGNPDVPIPTVYKGDWFEGVFWREGTWPTGAARWVDRRCHRSAYAGPAQAAKTLEYSDPHSSVTFISFACSGATINRETTHDGKNQGSGVLGKYRGIEPPNPGSPSSYDTANFLPAQIDALARTLAGCTPTDETCVNRQGRKIDSLVISGGGNDAYFADIVAACVLEQKCNFSANVRDTLVNPGLGDLPDRYDALANAIHNPSPAKRPALNLGSSGNVYLTQYPDPTRNESGATCDSILGDIVWGKHINRDEADWARREVIVPLNQRVQDAATRNAHRGWKYVDGISSQYARNGYCARDHWIVHPMESRRLQGPYYALPFEQWEHTDVLLKQTGMMHPNVMGHRAYGKAILPHLMTQFGQDPSNPLPDFSASPSTPDGTSTQGLNGWLTGSDLSGKALFTVAVEDPSDVAGGAVEINGSGTCPSTGSVECSVVDVSAQRKEWRFRFSQDGIHKLDFSARGKDGQATTYTHEVRVDLNDPQAAPAEFSREPDANNWYTAPVDVTLNGSDQLGGSGVYKIEYTIDGGPVKELEPGAKITVKADGVTHIKYRSVDLAGRKSPMHDFQVALDKTAPRVTAATPTGTGVKRNTNVKATFSEKMDRATIKKSTFQLFRVGADGTAKQVNDVTVTPSRDGLKATLDPFGSTSTTVLAKNTRYRVVVTTGVKDQVGNRMKTNKVWHFTTGSS